MKLDEKLLIVSRIRNIRLFKFELEQWLNIFENHDCHIEKKYINEVLPYSFRENNVKCKYDENKHMENINLHCARKEKKDHYQKINLL